MIVKTVWICNREHLQIQIHGSGNLGILQTIAKYIPTPGAVFNISNAALHRRHKRLREEAFTDPKSTTCAHTVRARVHGGEQSSCPYTRGG